MRIAWKASFHAKRNACGTLTARGLCYKMIGRGECSSMVEYQTVDLTAAGSSPVTHPSSSLDPPGKSMSIEVNLGRPFFCTAR